MRKAIAAIVLLALLGLVGWVAYQRATKKGESNRPRERGAAVAVRLAPVERGMIRDVSVFTGSVKPNTYFVCAPKISGPLKSLLVNIGDRVKSGQVIGVIDDEEYRQQVAQAEAELEVAKASLEEGRTVMELARRELARAQSLYAKQVASEADLDEAKARFAAQEAKFRVAQASLAQRDAALKAAQVRLSYTRITVSWREAPADEERIVAEKFADAGAMLAANAPVVSIIDLDPVLAVINVIERDYSKIGIGHAATVTTDAFPDKTFTGKVVRVAPLLKEASRQARVEVEVPNKDGLLKPGMFVRSDLQFDQRDNATLVPFAALVRRGGKQGVFTADRQALKAGFVPVKTGIAEKERVEVVEPALAGFVVVLGQHLLEDGGAIVLPEEKSEAPKQPGQGDGAPKGKGKRT